MHVKDHRAPNAIGWETGPGWDALLEELNEKLEAIDPNYTWVQVKQKFCRLSFYLGQHDRTLCPCTKGHGDCKMMYAIADADAKAATTCEHCGAQTEPGTVGLLLCGPCEVYRELRHKKNIVLI
jgi:hypothetical protein